jgi:hypothetical protein
MTVTPSAELVVQRMSRSPIQFPVLGDVYTSLERFLSDASRTDSRRDAPSLPRTRNDASLMSNGATLVSNGFDSGRTPQGDTICAGPRDRGAHTVGRGQEHADVISRRLRCGGGVLLITAPHFLFFSHSLHSHQLPSLTILNRHAFKLVQKDFWWHNAPADQGTTEEDSIVASVTAGHIREYQESHEISREIRTQ